MVSPTTPPTTPPAMAPVGFEDGVLELDMGDDEIVGDSEVGIEASAAETAEIGTLNDDVVGLAEAMAPLPVNKTVGEGCVKGELIDENIIRQ